MRALVLTSKDRSVSVQDIPVPVPGPKQILVHVQAVALNHVDLVYTVNPVAAQERRVVGSDFAGVVTQVSADLVGLADQRAKIGARVAGFVQGACSINDRPGAFAEHIAVDFDLTWNVPTSISFEAAATISMCGLTAAQGVFDRLQLPCPFHQTGSFDWLNFAEGEPVNVFIYGATSSLGLFAAQLVRLAEQTSGTNIRLIGAASASKHAMLLEAPYKYDLLVDYRDSDWPGKVREAAGARGGVQYALDAFSQGPSVQLTESTFGPQGRFAVFRSPVVGKFDISKLKIKPIIGAVWEALGVEIGYQGVTLPANPKAHTFAKEFFDYLGSEASSGRAKLVPNPVRHMPGGLEKIVLEGFALLGSNIASDKSSES
ncbi:chaperonin 10-like protein [Bisporella sp. PMI_857]|nr:chaperonin 10-like protein [Bisporella sp. PMI_857]